MMKHRAILFGGTMKLWCIILPYTLGYMVPPTNHFIRSALFQGTDLIGKPKQIRTSSPHLFMSLDEESLLEYLDDRDAGRLSFEEFKEQQKRERYLRECPIFQRCSSSDVSRIAKCMIPQNLTSNEIVFEEGALGNFMYFLERGQLEATKKMSNETTEAVVVATFTEAGTAFGELALLFDQGRAATVAAKVDSIVYRLDKAAFLDSVIESPIYETLKGIILKKYQSQRLVDILPKVRLDEVATLLAARLLGRFSTKRLAKTIATFSLGALSVVVTQAWALKLSMVPWVYLLFGLVGYMVN